jgi:hypothetical protein
MYSFYSFTTSTLDGGERSATRPGSVLLPGKGPQNPLYRRLGGPQSRSGHRGQRKKPLASARDRTSIAPAAIYCRWKLLLNYPCLRQHVKRQMRPWGRHKACLIFRQRLWNRPTLQGYISKWQQGRMNLNSVFDGTYLTGGWPILLLLAQQ